MGQGGSFTKAVPFPQRLHGGAEANYDNISDRAASNTEKEIFKVQYAPGTLLAGCLCLQLLFNSEPSKKDIIKGYQRLEPVILVLDKKIAANQPLPENSKILRIEYNAANQKPYPDKVFYGKMDLPDAQFYQLYTYIRARTSLWYLSAPDGGQGKGWWIDYDDGSWPTQVFPETGWDR